MEIEIGGRKWNVRVWHFRLPDMRYAGKPYGKMSAQEIREKAWSLKDFNENVFPRGGYTLTTIENSGVEYTGISTCSIADNFNKRTGRNLSLMRALTALSIGEGLVVEL